MRARTSFVGRLAVCLLFLTAPTAMAADGVFVRFRLREPAAAKYYVKLAGYIHQANWYLPSADIPAAAEKDPQARIAAGEFTDWFDLAAYAGKNLHGRLNLAGGIAEFPNLTARFVVQPESPRRSVEIELATAPNVEKVVKRWEEDFEGDITSFLVSPNLAADASQLETATEMSERRLRWAMEATGGKRHAPKSLLLQTSFWSPQRPELNLKEGKVLWLLGFNVVGGAAPDVRKQFPEFRTTSSSFDILLGPESDRQAVRAVWEKLGPPLKNVLQSGSTFYYQDEICSRPTIGTNANALNHFRQWLKDQKISLASLGVGNLDEVVPIETPEVLRKRMKANEPAARRVFFYTCRFRQQATTERLIWNTQELHRQLGSGPLGATLVADHPYFGGTGFGMGMDQPNTPWGGWHLAADWFDIARRRAVDMLGIEDWLGLQFMYGPQFTWEGFQLMGFQAAIARSASRGEQPVQTWITVSDERNFRLKAASALCQGSKHFYYWTYGPTATSTENYWSDQQGSYPGMARLSHMLELGEPIIAPGKPRPTRVALLYSISSDYWQPFGYAHMLERRGLYLALVHDQYLVDMLTEDDVAAGRLADYKILYTADPCISTAAAKTIAGWVKGGGALVATCAAGSRNEFGESSTQLAEVFGIDTKVSAACQPGEYRERGKLNDIAHRDKVKFANEQLGVVGVKAVVQPRNAQVKATFTSDGKPALVENRYGNGRVSYFAYTPGIGYIKDAHFVATALAEKWPIRQRQTLTHFANDANAPPLVKLSEPVVEAGIYEAPMGAALVLANFTYKPIGSLKVEVPTRGEIKSVKSLEHGSLRYETLPGKSAWREQGFPFVQRFELALGDDDLIVLENR
jgi:hypothetical protein